MYLWFCPEFHRDRLRRRLCPLLLFPHPHRRPQFLCKRPTTPSKDQNLTYPPPPPPGFPDWLLPCHLWRHISAHAALRDAHSPPQSQDGDHVQFLHVHLAVHVSRHALPEYHRVVRARRGHREYQRNRNRDATDRYRHHSRHVENWLSSIFVSVFLWKSLFTPKPLAAFQSKHDAGQREC